MSVRYSIVGLGLCIVLGCVPHTDPPATPAPTGTSTTTSPANTPSPPPAAAAVPAPPATDATNTAPENSAPPGNTPSEAAPAEAAANPGGENPTEQISAKAGVGKQGQSLKNETGVMVEAAKAYFNVRQRAVFEIQIPEALKLFEASEGRKPKSHEEFMERVITANSIKLPNLPANNRYIYDVERGELMVEKPAR